MDAAAPRSPACPLCAAPLEAGWIEGTYLAWSPTRPTPGGRFLRVMGGGMFLRKPMERIGTGFQPTVAEAYRCRTCPAVIVR